MKLVYIIILVDLAILLVLTKFIFGNMKIFAKAISGHVLSDFEDLETFQKWDKEHDIRHKMDLFYAAILAVCGGSFLLYTQL